MKKSILLFATILIATALSAQTQSHLKYDGIPINGDISNFAQDLTNLGYEYMDQDKDTFFFTGKNESIGNILLAIACLPEEAGRTVYAVMVTSPAQPSFGSCEAIYKRVQRSLDKKYGEGYYDEVIDKDYDEDDIDRMLAIVKGAGHYISTYLTNDGSITLSIMSNGGLLYTTVAYVDNANSKKAEKYL